MSNNQPNQPPFTQSNQPIPHLHYNNVGNSYTLDEYGRWIPNAGVAQVGCESLQ
jgi:hypothetical protein